MSLGAINEQLLRAVGVGVALFDAHSLQRRFQNDVFGTWFEAADADVRIGELFPQLDIDEMRALIDETGRYATELKVRNRRRTMVIAQVFTRAEIGDEAVIVLECQNITRIRELEAMIESYSAMVERNTRDIQREKEQVEKLLLNIMPRPVYEEYKASGIVSPQAYESVTVLVLDFVGFAATLKRLPPATFVGELNELYNAFDHIGEQFGCERIKTTGDTYICVAGMHDKTDDHARAVANSAIRFIRYLKRRNDNAENHWVCRIGVATGPVVGSVVGTLKYVYDVFGDAVDAANAARAVATEMEAVVSSETVALLAGALPLTVPQCGETGTGARALEIT